MFWFPILMLIRSVDFFLYENDIDIVALQTSKHIVECDLAQDPSRFAKQMYSRRIEAINPAETSLSFWYLYSVMPEWLLCASNVNAALNIAFQLHDSMMHGMMYSEYDTVWWMIECCIRDGILHAGMGGLTSRPWERVSGFWVQVLSDVELCCRFRTITSVLKGINHQYRCFGHTEHATMT